LGYSCNPDSLPKPLLPAKIPKYRHQTDAVFNYSKQRSFIETSGQSQLQAFETCLKQQPDFIFCHRLPAMGPVLKTAKPIPPVFFDLDDIEHVSFARKINQPPVRARTLLYYLQIPALFRGETKAIQRATQTYICSETDRQYLANRLRLPGISVVPNAVTIPTPQSLTSEPTLLLLGGYYFFPNRNAADTLIEQIWPLIRAKRPDARLIIAGRDPHLIRSYPKDPPGVEFTGFVEDLGELYARTRIVCCPVAAGSGTRVKLVEAAAYGKPIISTRLGAEGLCLEDGQSFLLRDSAADFAQGCLDLLNDLSLCQQLGEKARRAASENYNRQVIIQRLQATFKAQLGRQVGPGLNESRVPETLLGE
jgi:glycosyltransferase involved in cell wall biosynthesis